MNNYEQKYLKYKFKYLTLKTNIKGGAITLINKFEETQKNMIYNELTSFVRDIQTKCTISNNKEILVDNKKWLWDNIKKLFGNTNHVIMKKYFDLRKEIVDTLIKNIFIYFNCNAELCEQTASGSVGADANLLSDYDLTIVNQDLKTSEIIQMFNSIIMTVFNNSTPAEAFDTNLYGYSKLYVGAY